MALTAKSKTKDRAATFTTHDAVTFYVTVEAPRNKVGDTQIYAGREYVYNGHEWIVLENHSQG